MASHGWPIGQRDRQVDNHSKLDWHEQNIIADKIERRRQRISQLPKQTYIQTATTSYHTWQKLSKAAMTVATTLFWRTPLRALEYPNKGLKLHPHSQWGSPPRGMAWQPPSFHLACRKAGAGQDLLSRTGTEHQTGKDPAKWIKRASAQRRQALPSEHWCCAKTASTAIHSITCTTSAGTKYNHASFK